MTDTPEAVKKYMAELGRKSWEKRKGKQDMSELGKKAAAKRWADRKTAK